MKKLVIAAAACLALTACDFFAEHITVKGVVESANLECVAVRLDNGEIKTFTVDKKFDGHKFATNDSGCPIEITYIDKGGTLLVTEMIPDQTFQDAIGLWHKQVKDTAERATIDIQLEYKVKTAGAIRTGYNTWALDKKKPGSIFLIAKSPTGDAQNTTRTRGTISNVNGKLTLKLEDGSVYTLK